MAHRTLGEMKTWMAEQLHETETDTVLSANLIPRWASATYDRIVTWTSWKWNEDTVDLTWPGISAGADTSILYLPNWIDHILSLYPQQLSYRLPVRILGAREFDASRPGNTIGRGIDYLILHGYYGVELDNPSAAQLTVTSSGAAGDDGRQVIVKGLDVNNRELVETLTLAGGGTATTTGTFKGGVGGVWKFSLVPSTAWVGTSVTLANGGTTLEQLDATREVAHEHVRTELYAQIGGPGTYTCRVYRRHHPLVGDDDIPQIPNEFHDVMELGMLRYLALFRKDGEAPVYEGLFKERLRELTAWSKRQPGRKIRTKPGRVWGMRGYWG